MRERGVTAFLRLKKPFNFSGNTVLCSAVAVEELGGGQDSRVDDGPWHRCCSGKNWVDRDSTWVVFSNLVFFSVALENVVQVKQEQSLLA